MKKNVSSVTNKQKSETATMTANKARRGSDGCVVAVSEDLSLARPRPSTRGGGEGGLGESMGEGGQEGGK